MPPKKGTVKKSGTKIAAPAAAEMLNNGEKEVEDLSVAKILPNGNSRNAEYMKESPKSKVTQRGSDRTKNVALEVNMNAAPIKKPAAKGRGKKKLSENEVIDTEPDVAQCKVVNETKANEELKTKPKGRNIGKKAEPKGKKNSKTNDDRNEAVQVEDSDKSEEIKLPAKNTKVSSGRKKKPEVSKTEEQIEVMEEIEEETVEVKVSKKSPRNSKKTEEITLEIDPKKKKGKIVNKKTSTEKDNVVVATVDLNTAKAEVTAKKSTKRGRATSKAAIAVEETPAVNGDTEEVVPKKRSRKAPPGIEKEILKEKSKRSRAKKTGKLEEDISENDVESNGKEVENATNGQAKQKIAEVIEEHPSSNKTAEKHTETAVLATKTKGGLKRAAPSANNKKTSKKTEEYGDELDIGVDNTDVEKGSDVSKPSKTKKSKTDSVPLNAKATEYDKIEFDLPPPSDEQTIEEPRFNLKISSWNVAGLRAWLKKDGLKFLDFEQPDIFCMQETKCTNDQLPEEVMRIPGYHPYWLCMPGGHAGVAIYSKIMPINVEYGIGNKEFDESGRIITAEYEKFFLINVYVPNSGRKLVNLDGRMKWEKIFQQFLKKLDERKPVVICGDMNVSHQEHDLANPKTNTRSAGFTKEERDKMTELLALGYVDTFRHLYPERKGAYTFWTYMGNARSRNIGWRLDYFIVSERFINRVVDNCIRSQCFGSDHCPITLFLKL